MARAGGPRSRSRPRTVLALMVLVSLQAIVLLVIGGVLVAARADLDAADAALLPVVGGVLAAAGLLQLILVALLGRGSEVARSTFGILAGLQTAAGVYSTIALREIELAAILPLTISVSILWLLYGGDVTRQFFAP